MTAFIIVMSILGWLFYMCRNPIEPNSIELDDPNYGYSTQEPVKIVFIIFTLLIVLGVLGLIGVFHYNSVGYGNL